MEEIIRPPAEKRKIHSRNEFELCYIRHQYLRKVKFNPTPEEMEPYRPIIRYLGRKTYYTYARLFHTVGMTLDDIVSIGMVNLVNFIGLFEIGPNKNVEKYNQFVEKKGIVEVTPKMLLGKNRANLTLFMKQRMEDLVRICRQKAKNIKGLEVDPYVAFFGPERPSGDLYKLILDCESVGFKKVDNVQFKAIRKKAKGKIGIPFKWAGYWYVAVQTIQRPLSWFDLTGAGYDPYENEHNLNPEQILMRNHEENRIDKRIKVFKNSSKEYKARILTAFVEKHADDPTYRDEITTAQRMLRTIGFVDVER